MKTAFAFVTCLAISLSVIASPKSENDINTGIAGAVERYVSSIACGGVTIKPEDVLTLAPSRNPEALPKYAVLWTGDVGCFGGSGTERTHLAIATVNTGQYVVQPALSSPVVAFETPVIFVSRVVSYSAEAMVLEGFEHAPNDARNNPSIPVQFTLRADEKGHWKLVDKGRMESKTIRAN